MSAYGLPAYADAVMRRPSRHVHDDWLGYVPRPGHAEPGLTIGPDGLRSTGEPPADASTLPPILAVGDSFTFGEDVSDTETWPAQLQRLTGRRVLNDGVSGYGFDQIVLRAERLAVVHKPLVIVASFIADDIRRTEMRRLWWHNKPWFALESGQLVAKGTPVPRRNPPRTSLGSSRVLERALRLLTPVLQDWFGYHVRVHPAGTGAMIACRLTERLADLQRTSGARVIVVAAYDSLVWHDRAAAADQRRMTRDFLDWAARNGVHTLDSFSLLAAAPRPRQLYKSWHMNERGNRLIASLVAAALPS